MKKATRFFAGAVCCMLIGAGMGAFAGCGGKSEEIVVGGSSSVSPLMSVLADAYMEDHDVTITVTTTDSGTGISNAESGSYAIGMASKKVEGYDDLTTATLCMDGIACVVNKNCTTSEVTIDALKALYTTGTAIDEITNVISRESGSGTFDAFNEKVGFKESEMRKTGIDVYNSTAAVLSAIASNTAGNTLGYASLGSVREGDVKILKVNGVAATAENVLNGTYAIQRPFVIMYNKNNGLGEAEKAFFDWLFTDEAKAIIEAEGYVNL